MGSRAVWSVVCLVAAGCTPTTGVNGGNRGNGGDGGPTSASETGGPPGKDAGTAMSESIGNARMEADGTIVLDLIARGGGAIGHARKVYPPSHAEYKKVLEHLGGLRPGEQKLVPPWPDPWDAARVEAAAREHATRVLKLPSDYRLEITGTDRDGNAVVSLAYGEGKSRKSVQVRIDPKTYAVVGGPDP